MLSLSAFGGSESLKAADLFSPGTGFWTLAGTVTQPIFEGGILLHKERAARAALDQAAAQYSSTVVTAFQNVADALRALQTDADAVRIANDSEFGLGGSVWSRDAERALGVARKVNSGTIGVNGYMPSLGSPFGGVKASGMGREFGPEAIGAYQQFKSIYVMG